MNASPGGTDHDEQIAASVVQVACDRCTQGVMDSTNPHMLGTCSCSCHLRPEIRMTTAELEARVDEWVRNG